MAMWICPSCEAKVASDGCSLCGEPIQACGRCGTFNRSLARQCRSCCAAFKYHDVLFGVYSTVVKKWSAPDKCLFTQERFWVAPIAYGGWLWLQSTEGQLSRYSPFWGRLEPVVHLGEEYGCTAPMARAEMPAGEKWIQPSVIALSTKSITAVGMIDAREIKIKLESDETGVADFTKEPCGVEGAGQEAYLLTRRNGHTFLAIASFMTGKVESRIKLPESSVAGPFFCAGNVHVYSETHMHLISGGQVRSYAFPTGFKASVEIKNQTLHQAFGRLPFMVRGSTFYIPGTQGSRLVFLMHKTGSGATGSAIIPVTGETTYLQDGIGRPVLAQEARISVLEDAVNRVVQEDAQLSSMYPALAIDGIAVGMAEPSPSTLRLRIYQNETRADFLVPRETFRESVGVYTLGKSLTFCSALKDTTIGIYSWIC